MIPQLTNDPHISEAYCKSLLLNHAASTGFKLLSKVAAFPKCLWYTGFFDLVTLPPQNKISAFNTTGQELFQAMRIERIFHPL